MKKIILLFIFTSMLSASIGLDLDYSSSFLSFNRGGEEQEIISNEEIQGEIFNEKDYSSELDESVSMMRLYNSAAINLKFSKSIRLYTRFRHAYGLYEDDMYTPFALNRFYAAYKSKMIDVKAGRFFASDRTIRRSLDGASLNLKLGSQLKTRVLYGAVTPSVYSGNVAPDFFGKQYLLLQQSYYSTSIGKMTGGYTLTIDEKSEDVFSHDLAGSWKASIAETYISAYGEYLLTDGKMGNSVLNLTRNFGHKVLVNLDYRVVLQKNWIIDAEDDVYFTGHAYDVFRLGAFYELSQKLALEFSSLSTAYKNDSYYNTYLELISKVGGLGVVYVNTPHGSEINLSAKASYSLFKDALNLEAGYNYITEEISFDETENASGSGSYFGLKYHILNGLNVRLNYYKMDSPQFNSNSRLLLKLNYRLSI